MAGGSGSTGGEDGQAHDEAEQEGAGVGHLDQEAGCGICGWCVVGKC